MQRIEDEEEYYNLHAVLHIPTGFPASVGMFLDTHVPQPRSQVERINPPNFKRANMEILQFFQKLLDNAEEKPSKAVATRDIF